LLLRLRNLTPLQQVQYLLFCIHYRFHFDGRGHVFFSWITLRFYFSSPPWQTSHKSLILKIRSQNLTIASTFLLHLYPNIYNVNARRRSCIYPENITATDRLDYGKGDRGRSQITILEGNRRRLVARKMASSERDQQADSIPTTSSCMYQFLRLGENH